MRSSLLLPVVIALAMPAACGTKTPLILPPGAATPPLFGTANSALAKPAAKQAPAATTPAVAPVQTGDDNKPTSGAVAP